MKEELWPEADTMKCGRCLEDARPILFNGQVIAPCGRIPKSGNDYLLLCDIGMEGCPMADKQLGYIQALKDSK